MPNDIPLSILIPQILSHSPSWVWFVLALITIIGLTQLSSRTMSPIRLIAMPLAMSALSISAVLGAFGASPATLAGWLGGIGAALALGQVLRWPRNAVRDSRGHYRVAGSMVPLLLIWSIFVARYLVAVTLVLHPGLSHDTGFALAVAALYGLFSGLFIARALRIVLVATGRAREVGPVAAI